MANIANDHQSILFFFAKAFAQVSRGPASLLDWEGRRLTTIDFEGHEIKELKGKLCHEAMELLRQGKLEKFKIFQQGEFWFFPMEKYLLALDLTGRIKENKNLEEEFIKALPAIAAVVGGNAIIFGQDGIRKAGYEPSGRPCRGIGEYSEHGHEVMQKKQPLVGASALVEGA